MSKKLRTPKNEVIQVNGNDVFLPESEWENDRSVFTSNAMAHHFGGSLIYRGRNAKGETRFLVRLAGKREKGKPGSTTFYGTPKEALQELERLAGRRSEGLDPIAQVGSFEHMFRGEYTNAKLTGQYKKPWKGRTCKGAHQFFRLYVPDELKRKDVTKITEQEIAGIALQMKASNKSWATVRNMNSYLRDFFGYLMSQYKGDVPWVVNPAENMPEQPKPDRTALQFKLAQLRHCWLDANTVANYPGKGLEATIPRFLALYQDSDEWRRENYQTFMMIAVSLFFAPRPAEATPLHKESYDPIKRELRIAESYGVLTDEVECETEGMKRIYYRDFTDIKNGVSRIIAAHQTIHEHLVRYIAWLGVEEAEGRIKNPLGLLFPGKRGQIMIPDKWAKRMKRWMEKNNLPVIPPYRLRHSCATMFINAGVKVNDIALLLGDNPMTVKAVYAHIIKNDRTDLTPEMTAALDNLAKI